MKRMLSDVLELHVTDHSLFMAFLHPSSRPFAWLHADVQAQIVFSCQEPQAWSKKSFLWQSVLRTFQ
uniref:Uncharacterized protein n=1 Tax=Steinernema glaseri TaxID=37863 RepID=A0A1I7Y994_9BILA